MNEREFHNILESIAQEEIPDDMQLWNKIEARLNTPNTRRTTRLNRLGRAAVYLLVALAVTTVGYAFYQQLIQVGGDPGIIAVQDLVTPIDQTQKHPTQDMNLTIKWAYADGHRIAFEWQADYLNTYQTPFPAKVQLFDANGNEFPPADFLQGGGGGGGGDGVRSSVGSTHSFGTRGIPADTESLDVKLVMTFSSLLESEVGGGSIGRMGGGGGGGGGSSSEGESVTPEPLIPIESFVAEFDLTVPFISAKSIDAGGSVESNGITLTLSDISYAPSVTLAKMCHTPIDREGTWTPVLQVNPKQDNSGYPFSMDYADFVVWEEPQEGEPVCGELVIFSQPPEDGVIHFSVVGFVSQPLPFTLERVTRFEQELEAKGFEITIIEPDGPKGMDYRIDKTPEAPGVDYYRVLSEVYGNIFYDSIDGTWAFDIPLPR